MVIRHESHDGSSSAHKETIIPWDEERTRDQATVDNAVAEQFRASQKRSQERRNAAKIADQLLPPLFRDYHIK